MPFNGSGVFTAVSLPGSFNPAISGQDATPDDWNSLLDDIELGLSTCWTTDGQSTITANQPMAGFKFTGVGDATARTQYASMGQIQDGGGVYSAAGGTADALTITLAPALAAYAVGQRFRIKMGAGANTTAVTLNANTIGAGAVVWPDGTALVAGDIPANAMFDVEVQNITVPTAPVFHLQTVATPPLTTARAAAGHVYIQVFTGNGTYTPHAGLVTADIIAVGGGGGGGGTANSAGTAGVAGGGGGAGSWSRTIATAATVGASLAVGIGAAGAAGTSGTNNGGAGGDTSVGAICIGKGGSGGTGGGSGGGVSSGLGGAGGVSGTGSVTTTGAPGETPSTLGGGIGAATNYGGGNSLYGGGGGSSGGSGAGADGTGHGSGGAGGSSFVGAGAFAGGAGTAGYVYIIEYCNQ